MSPPPLLLLPYRSLALGRGEVIGSPTLPDVAVVALSQTSAEAKVASLLRQSALYLAGVDTSLTGAHLHHASSWRGGGVALRKR